MPYIDFVYFRFYSTRDDAITSQESWIFTNNIDRKDKNTLKTYIKCMVNSKKLFGFMFNKYLVKYINRVMQFIHECNKTPGPSQMGR